MVIVWIGRGLRLLGLPPKPVSNHLSQQRIDPTFGQTVQCPACSGRLEIPKADEAAETPGGRPQREGWAEGDHANADFVKSLLIGGGITILFLLMMFPFKGTRFADIFIDRG